MQKKFELKGNLVRFIRSTSKVCRDKQQQKN